jgi:hypothetical protein
MSCRRQVPIIMVVTVHLHVHFIAWSQLVAGPRAEAIRREPCERGLVEIVQHGETMLPRSLHSISRSLPRFIAGSNCGFDRCSGSSDSTQRQAASDLLRKLGNSSSRSGTYQVDLYLLLTYGPLFFLRSPANNSPQPSVTTSEKALEVAVDSRSRLD